MGPFLHAQTQDTLGGRGRHSCPHGLGRHRRGDVLRQRWERLQRREKRGVGVASRRGKLPQRLGGGKHHPVGDTRGPGGGHSEAHRRKNVEVVALGDGDGATAEVHWWAGASDGDQRSPIRPADEVSGLRLLSLGWVGEREDDGA